MGLAHPHLCDGYQEYLGHIVSGDGVRCDPDKVSAVWDWPTPICVTDIRFRGVGFLL